MNRVAGSFSWPFRAPLTSWLLGALCVLLLPLLFVPLLGYAIAATRAAERDEGPPPWVISRRLFADGFWAALVVALTVAPFALVLPWLAHALRGGLIGTAAALFVLLFFWGLLALVFLPHATAAFAAGGRPADMLNFAASARRVRADFATWNVVVAAIVTGWALGLACAAVLCVGVVPGIFYAILVSAHAGAALDGKGQHPSAR